jgi:predicted double-glycine peptidase
MVLESFGVVRTEPELCDLCKCDESGTHPDDLVNAAQTLGRTRTHKEFPSLNALKSYLDQGLYPIAYVGLPKPNPQSLHAVVVVEISVDEVTVYDPAWGECVWSLDDFLQAWSWKKRLTILIE